MEEILAEGRENHQRLVDAGKTHHTKYRTQTGMETRPRNRHHSRRTILWPYRQEQAHYERLVTPTPKAFTETMHTACQVALYTANQFPPGQENATRVRNRGCSSDLELFLAEQEGCQSAGMSSTPMEVARAPGGRLVLNLCQRSKAKDRATARGLPAGAAVRRETGEASAGSCGLCRGWLVLWSG